MDVKAFANRIIAGPQPLKVTGPDKGQCTAVAHQWSLDNSYPIVYGDAADTYANAPATFYIRVPYTPGMRAPSGSIAVWGQNNVIGTTEDGHTAVVLPGADSSTFESVDQNWPVGSRCRTVRHPYTGVIGFLLLNKIGGDMAADKLTKEEIIVTHRGFYFADPPQTTINHYLNKPLSEMLTDFANSPQRKDIEETWNAMDDGSVVLGPGHYIIK